MVRLRYRCLSDHTSCRLPQSTFNCFNDRVCCHQQFCLKEIEAKFGVPSTEEVQRYQDGKTFYRSPRAEPVPSAQLVYGKPERPVVPPSAKSEKASPTNAADFVVSHPCQEQEDDQQEEAANKANSWRGEYRNYFIPSLTILFKDRCFRTFEEAAYASKYERRTTGITKIGDGKYQLRSGKRLCESPSGEISWIRGSRAKAGRAVATSLSQA